MIDRRFWTRAGLVGVTMLAVAGCASSADISSLESEVIVLQDSLNAAQQAADRAADRADAAAQSAAQAAESAAAAAAAAEAAADRADRIFAASQRK